MEENKDIGTEVYSEEKSEFAPKRSFGKWAENVWYHYKWHILISLFMIAVLAICITQCVRNAADEPDIHILYAGSKQISQPNDREDGKTPFKNLEGVLTDISSDYDESGEKIVDLETVYWVHPDDRGPLMGAESDKSMTDAAYYVSLFNESIATIDSLRQKSDYFVWFVSVDVYNYVKEKADGAEVFMPISLYVEDGTTVNYYGEDGDAIWLKDLFAYNLDGIDEMPADTLVVLRTPTVLERNEDELFERSEAFIRAFINLG